MRLNVETLQDILVHKLEIANETKKRVVLGIQVHGC
mgnify:FL=1